jgi:hypothetical protein
MRKSLRFKEREDMACSFYVAGRLNERSQQNGKTGASPFWQADSSEVSVLGQQFWATRSDLFIWAKMSRSWRER